MLVDTYFYNGEFTVSPLRFYTANVTQGLAVHFGVQPWHWNITNVSVSRQQKVFTYMWR